MLLALLLLIAPSKINAEDYYTAAVVEYATPYTPEMTADEVLLKNAAAYVYYMGNASLRKVDIIVFPEGGLFGHLNKRKSIDLPSPGNNINPCDNSSGFHYALVMLSCAAKQFKMYAVININEQFHNTTTDLMEYYNSNVVFDRNGTVVGRYRKFNPYGEPVSKPALEHHYFETDFGVKFGMFICFDIAFLEPGVTLAREFGIRHFAFPHCWISELPFLTAIQAQWGWAYSMNTVLLAAGCNNPETGGTGSGIYHGRNGALTYLQTNNHTSRLLISRVPLSFEPENSTDKLIQQGFTYKEESNRMSWQEESGLHEVHLLDDFVASSDTSNGSLVLLRDYTDVYKSRLLIPSGDFHVHSNIGDSKSSSIAFTLTTETTLCQNDFCCDFQIQMRSLYNNSAPTETVRGDDFTGLYYRLVAFDGVRWYGGGLATGGVQLCGVISCVNQSLSSCGLRADDVSAKQSTYSSPFYGTLFKKATVFESISIQTTFFYNNTFVYPDIFVTGSGDDFGALVPSDKFTYETFGPLNGSLVASLRIDKPITNLVTAAIYARQCDRDGLSRTESSSNYAHPFGPNVFTLCVLFFLFFHCVFIRLY